MVRTCIILPILCLKTASPTSAPSPGDKVLGMTITPRGWNVSRVPRSSLSCTCYILYDGPCTPHGATFCRHRDDVHCRVAHVDCSSIAERGQLSQYSMIRSAENFALPNSNRSTMPLVCHLGALLLLVNSAVEHPFHASCSNPGPIRSENVDWGK
jgi:hypothetical protein